MDTSRTSINDALLKVSTGVRDADDIYDSMTKSENDESCKSKLVEEGSGSERTTQDGRVAERTQIVDLSSLHEKHQDPEQISAEGERKKGVNIATNDNDKSKIGKECSGQTIKEHGGDQTTVEANLDEESPQDEKVSVAEERKEVDGERDSTRNCGWRKNGQQKNVELNQQRLRWRERKILKLLKMAVIALSVIGGESWDK